MRLSRGDHRFAGERQIGGHINGPSLVTQGPLDDIGRGMVDHRRSAPSSQASASIGGSP